MKTKSKYFCIAVLIITLPWIASCDKHDSLDDNVMVGKMAPHIYWELGSSTVTAGDSVPFTAQYYTTSTIPIDHLEVWYSVTKEESKSAACPWTTTFKYSISSTKTSLQRISQLVNTYPHSEDVWDANIRAYTFKSKFPTAGTLSSTSWVKPMTFEADDSVKMDFYFGNDFMQHFKDSLYTRMKVKDFQNMYLGLNLIDDFKPYLDSIFNNNTYSWEYLFPKDNSGNRPVPNEISEIYKKIPFSDLIFNKTNNNYEVEFTRFYLLKPVLKVIDKEHIEGVTSINTDVGLN